MPSSSSEPIRELRLRYTEPGMAELIALIDNMNLGVLPEKVALFLAHASNAASWHEADRLHA